jgi:hypothetical protein
MIPGQVLMEERRFNWRRNILWWCDRSQKAFSLSCSSYHRFDRLLVWISNIFAATAK